MYQKKIWNFSEFFKDISGGAYSLMLQILATIMNYFTVNYQGFYKNG